MLQRRAVRGWVRLIVFVIFAAAVLGAIVGVLVLAEVASGRQWRRAALVLAAFGLVVGVVVAAPAPDPAPSPCKSANTLARSGSWDAATAAYVSLLSSDSKAAACASAGLGYVDTSRCAAARSIAPSDSARARTMYAANLRPERQTAAGRECARAGLDAVRASSAPPEVEIVALADATLAGSSGNLVDQFESGGTRLIGYLPFVDEDVDPGPVEGVIALLIGIVALWVLHRMLWRCVARSVAITDFVNATGDDKTMPAALTSQVRIRLARTGIDPPAAVPTGAATTTADALKALETSGIPQAGLISNVIGVLVQLFRSPDPHQLTGTVRKSAASANLDVDTQLTGPARPSSATFSGETLDDVVDPLADHVYFEAMHRGAHCRIPRRAGFTSEEAHSLYQQAIRLDEAAAELEDADGDR